MSVGVIRGRLRSEEGSRDPPTRHLKRSEQYPLDLIERYLVIALVDHCDPVNQAISTRLAR